MNRRDFLRTTTGRAPRVLELSGEQLYMRYLDARLAGTTRQFFDGLRRDLQCAVALRLRGTRWLRHDAARNGFDGILQEFRSRGGTIESSS